MKVDQIEEDPPLFRIKCSADELRYLEAVVGETSTGDDVRLGLPFAVGSAVFRALQEAVDAAGLN